MATKNNENTDIYGISNINNSSETCLNFESDDIFDPECPEHSSGGETDIPVCGEDEHECFDDQDSDGPSGCKDPDNDEPSDCDNHEDDEPSDCEDSESEGVDDSDCGEESYCNEEPLDCDEPERDESLDCEDSENDESSDCDCTYDGDEIVDCDEPERDESLDCEDSENDESSDCEDSESEGSGDEVEEKGDKGLENVIKNKTKIDKIVLVGYAFTNGKTDVPKTIINKRMDIIQAWLKEKLGSDIIFEREYKPIDGNEPKDVNSNESIIQRRIDIDIVYNAPKVDKQNDKKEKKDNKINEVNDGTGRVDDIKGYNIFTEAQYFKTLESSDPIQYSCIKNKIKYFNPAFHSITPEGFNMRLNFLQQCTRQGPTIQDATASSGRTAYNLAFGRPPVCVLRIGDFIHTKMIIRSLSITYESSNGMQWDMNPEGIGVQPMFAKINMGIDLIGGQSLKEPINKLNNAISYNFYANTEVYNEEDFKEKK